jgi:hypothetical protein
MDRNHRILSGKLSAASRLNAYARQIDEMITRIGIPAEQKDSFVEWALQDMWDKFKEHRMNKRILIENDIKDLNIRIPNGTVNKHYEAHFDLPVDKISKVEIPGIENYGLSFNIDENGKCTISGKPSKPGDFILSINYNTIEGEPTSTQNLPIAFNPDPRSIWKEIPVDPEIPYPKASEESAYITVKAGPDGLPRKDLVAASRRGRSHAHEGKPRDDDFKMLHIPESDWYIIAVADGAGSAKLSRKGSEVACKTVVDYCEQQLKDNPAFEQAIRNYGADNSDESKKIVSDMVHNIIFKGAHIAQQEVIKLADKDKNWQVKDFSTTLMFAICKRYEFGWFISSFWVGDGAMCLFNQNTKTIRLLGTPDEGEYSGQTRFLNMPGIFNEDGAYGKRVRMGIVPEFTALFLMTDGVSDPMFETERNLNDYDKWEEFYQRLQNGFPEDEICGVDLKDDHEGAKLQLLEWLNFWSTGNHDDRTIAILY